MAFYEKRRSVNSISAQLKRFSFVSACANKSNKNPRPPQHTERNNLQRIKPSGSFISGARSAERGLPDMNAE
jgi:hypothetical protein